ncbi:hypothetical protein V6N13_139935 [Hibiscus sabdariffa]|uniref:Uncharacterized protein n=1 Tax=Hibiscus sabdariffa TaxID=183260 RepID=A0ABR2QBM7_9ROSI
MSKQKQGASSSSTQNERSIKALCFDEPGRQNLRWELVGTEWKHKGKRAVDDEEDVLHDVGDPVNLITDEHHTDTDAAGTLPEDDLPPHFRVLLHSIDMRLTTMRSELDERLTKIETELREIRGDLNAGFKGPPPEN